MPDGIQLQRWFLPVLPLLTLSCPTGSRRAARPDIPSFCFVRESGGEQLLFTWLMALWGECAYPAEPFARLPSAVAVVGRSIVLTLCSLRRGEVVPDTPLFHDARYPRTVTSYHRSPGRARLLPIPCCATQYRVARAAPPRLGLFVVCHLIYGRKREGNT